MNPDEIQAYREKHHPIELSQGKIGAIPYCVGCKTSNQVLATPYPCDVIRVLDWAEAVAEDLSARIEGGP